MMQRKVWWASIIVVALLLCFFESAGWAQCEMCKTALTSSPEGKKLANGFRHGVLLLLLAPYALFGTAGLLIFNAYRRKEQERKWTHYLTILNRWLRSRKPRMNADEHR